MIEQSINWFIPVWFVIDGYFNRIYGHWVTPTMAQGNNYKAPPTLTDNLYYEKWKREIKIWIMFSSLEKKKQAPAIF